jgi:hypothetical protein
VLGTPPVPPARTKRCAHLILSALSAPGRRDFFRWYCEKQGDAVFKLKGPIGLGRPWFDDADLLQRWKAGRTGVPLVDANMRELAATGFMSNRGRQNVASYLALDLGIDWRQGEMPAVRRLRGACASAKDFTRPTGTAAALGTDFVGCLGSQPVRSAWQQSPTLAPSSASLRPAGADHFESLLVDYEPTANWGNWVSAAGLTGGRLNRFNIVKQSNDYDREGEYIRHWIPELAKVRGGRGEGRLVSWQLPPVVLLSPVTPSVNRLRLTEIFPLSRPPATPRIWRPSLSRCVHGLAGASSIRPRAP